MVCTVGPHAGGSDEPGVVSEAIKNSIMSVAEWLAEQLFTLLDPIVTYGCMVGIICCVMIYFATQDRKILTNALKFFFGFTIFQMLRGLLS